MSSGDLFADARAGGDHGAGPGGTAYGTADAPLAVRMRPRTLAEVRGQDAVLTLGSPLRRLVEGSGGRAGPLSAILWGPPGTGKTTLAHLVAGASGRRFVELSAVTAGVKDVRDVMAQAARERDLYGRHTVLFLDEIHRFSKAQQDALLPGVENRTVILDRRDHREPELRGHRTAAVPLGPRRSGAVVGRRPRGSRGQRADRREAWPGHSASNPRPRHLGADGWRRRATSPDCAGGSCRSGRGPRSLGRPAAQSGGADDHHCRTRRAGPGAGDGAV
jgi:hypothetical protein